MQALLIIDPQVDFISGSLAVPGATAAMDALADYVRAHPDRYSDIIVTADSHPADHCSFISNGGQWPEHCVRDTAGAAIWPAIADALSQYRGKLTLLTKGDTADREEYSIFHNSQSAKNLLEIVRTDSIDTIDICGIAGDICVADTLREAVVLMPDVRFNVLTRFTPSLDGGPTLDTLITNLGLSRG